MYTQLKQNKNSFTNLHYLDTIVEKLTKMAMPQEVHQSLLTNVKFPNIFEWRCSFLAAKHIQVLSNTAGTVFVPWPWHLEDIAMVISTVIVVSMMTSFQGLPLARSYGEETIMGRAARLWFHFSNSHNVPVCPFSFCFLKQIKYKTTNFTYHLDSVTNNHTYWVWFWLD